MGDYYIKDSYEARNEVHTIDDNQDEVYWNEDRLQLSADFQWPVYEKARKIVQSHGLNKILDIGCGPAVKLIRNFSGLGDLIVGVDQSHPIRYCRKTYSTGQFYVDDIENPELDLDESFDLVLSVDVIEHLMNPDLLIDYIKRYVKQNGWIIISTPDRDRLRGKDCQRSNKPDHVREWNKEEFLKYLESRGLKIIEHEFQSPLRLSSSSWKMYLKTLLQQWKAGRSFFYNQSVLAKLSL